MESDIPENSVAVVSGSKWRRISFCAILAAVLLFVDQLSKHIIVQTYFLHESTPVIPDIFSINHFSIP